ncbi:cobalamin-dependent protein [Chloroflexota bacterium]
MENIKVLLINVSPARDTISPGIDKRAIEYFRSRDVIGVEGGDQRHEPNNGLLFIGNALLKGKFGVEYLDINAKEVKYFSETGKYFSRQQINETLDVKINDIRFALISCLTPGVNNGFEIANYIKSRNPNCIIMFGGIFPTLNPNYCIEKCKSVDVVVVGEGEIIIPKIIKAYIGNDFSALQSAGFILLPGCNLITR